MMEIDELSLLVTIDGDETIEKLNVDLSRRGYFFPYMTSVNKNKVSLSEALLNNHPNLLEAHFGSLKDLCIGFEFTADQNHFMGIHQFQHAAVGPSLKNVLIGIGADNAVFTSVTLQVIPLPESMEYAYLSFLSLNELLSFEKKLIATDLVPSLRSRLNRANQILGADHNYAFLFSCWGSESIVSAKLKSIEDLAYAYNSHLVQVEDPLLIKKIHKQLTANEPCPLGSKTEVKYKPNLDEKNLKAEVLRALVS